MRHSSTLIKKFLFKSTLLFDLRILNPEERSSLDDFPNIIICLAEQLPQLGLTDKLDELRMKALDFQMADLSDLPTSDVNAFWAYIHKIKSTDSNSGLAYEHLLVLVRGLFALPASNADSERCFSMVIPKTKATWNAGLLLLC